MRALVEGGVGPRGEVAAVGVEVYGSGEVVGKDLKVDKLEGWNLKKSGAFS